MPGIAIGLGIDRGAKAVALDPATIDFVTRTGITDPIQIGAVNQLVVNLKASSLWNKPTAIYPFVGGTAAAHAQNLKSNLYTIVWTGVTHNSNGVTGNGSTAFGQLPTPSTLFTLNSAHALVYNRSPTPTTGGAWFGAVHTTTLRGDVICAENSTGFILGCINDNSFAGASVVTRTIGVSRVSSSVMSIFANNTPANFSNPSTAVPSSVNLILLARSFEGFTHDKFSNANIAYASFGAGLTDAELVTYAGHIQTFQTALGRQV